MLVCKEATISLRNLKIRTIIGVYDDERHKERELILNLDLKIAENGISLSDHLCDTVDYAAVATRLSEWARSQRSHLLEHFAQLAIGEIFKVDEKIRSVSLEIFKPGCIADADGAALRMSFSKE